MTWRALLIDRPARVVDVAWRLYWIAVAIATILCFINVTLWVVLYLLGIPLP